MESRAYVIDAGKDLVFDQFRVILIPFSSIAELDPRSAVSSLS